MIRQRPGRVPGRSASPHACARSSSASASGETSISGELTITAREKRCGICHQVPGFCQRVRLFDPDVEHVDGAAGLSGEHHGSWFGDVTRSAWTIDGKRRVKTLIHASRHDRQSAQASACRASLGSSKAEVFDHAARPLSVEVGGVHHDHAPVAPVPRGRNDAAMPKGGNHRLAPCAGLVGSDACPGSSKRSVGPRMRMTAMTAEAMIGICIRRQRESCGKRVS